MITREADYAVRAMVCLARHSDSAQAVSCMQLSEGSGVPYRFLRKIVSKLAAAGLVESRRGRSGGVVLTKTPPAIRLLEVINAVDRRGTRLNACLTPDDDCDRRRTCTTRKKLLAVETKLDELLAGIGLDELV